MAEPVQTDLRLHNTEKWNARGHLTRLNKPCDHDITIATVEMRRIGWIDQAGKVWLSDVDWMKAGGPNGSVTPLLIAADCD